MVKINGKIKGGLIALSDVVIGSIATLASYMHSQDTTFGYGTYSRTYGFPLNWLEKETIVYPGNPTFNNFYINNFLMDVVFWTLIAIPITIGLYKGYKWYKGRK